MTWLDGMFATLPLTWLDVLALAFFAGLWIGYQWY